MTRAGGRRATGGDAPCVHVIAADGAELAAYLTSAGFVASAHRALPKGPIRGALVLVAEDLSLALRSAVVVWLGIPRITRVVVVTGQPRGLADLAADHPDRLRVLAAPAFGWHVVDALRAPIDGPE